MGSLLGLPRDPARPRFSFGARERDLTEWLRGNAMVCWVECTTPWTFEEHVIASLRPLLNLKHNATGSFAEALATVRRAARTVASDFQ